jgi:hypothetical protein
MNLNVDARSMQTLVELVLAARDEVENEATRTSEPSGDCPLPYAKEPAAVECESTRSGRVRHAVGDLLSGIGRRR